MTICVRSLGRCCHRRPWGLHIRLKKQICNVHSSSVLLGSDRGGDDAILNPPEGGCKTNMAAFSRFASELTSSDLTKYEDLHRWSVSDPGAFWAATAKFTDVKWCKIGDDSTHYIPPPASSSSLRGASWFDGYELNFARNILPPPDDSEYVICESEHPELPTLRMTGKQLSREVARCAKALRAAGIGKGDVVAGVLINGPEAVVCLLGATSIGAIWSGCSPDFGVGGISDRLGQLNPKMLFFSEEYYYNGRLVDCRPKLEPLLKSFGKKLEVVLVPYWGFPSESSANFSRPPPKIVTSVNHSSHSISSFSTFLNTSGLPTDRGEATPSVKMEFEPTSFDHPVYISFSSGTTGQPKCIVHGAGGVLLQHKKELMLHCDVKEGDTMKVIVCCYRHKNIYVSKLTTLNCNKRVQMLSSLSLKSTIVTYEGSPAFPAVDSLWDVAAKHRVTHLGTSPKYISACMKAGVDLGGRNNFQFLRTILSTGSPISAEHYHWVYSHVKHNVHLASITGGTDLLGCFALGHPGLPVRPGEIQVFGLGMNVAIVNPETGMKVTNGPGELACLTPFPSMPIKFLHDPAGTKYESAYFGQFPQGSDAARAWGHGDLLEITPAGGIVVKGRSDSTLNPGGVRIGTADIYRAVELGVPEVVDCVAASLREPDGDMSVALFIKLSPPGASDIDMDEIERNIRAVIKTRLTNRHVPAYIRPVADIPYTLNGKKMEVIVTSLINGSAAKGTTSVANPGCLSEYENIGKELRKRADAVAH